LHDYQFERVWNYPDRYIDVLKKFAFVLSPQFSMYEDMPLVTKLYNLYRNRWCGRYWQENGVTEGKEYAILTNEIYKSWSGMTAKEYKEYKGLRKESLRDNMDNIEIILTDLSEETTKRLAEKHKPQGLEQNKEIARMGGHAAKVARTDIERNLGESIVTKNNLLNYQYQVEKNMLENNKGR